MRRRHLWAVLATLVLVAGACSDDDDDTATAGDDPGAAADAMVELLEAGAEPRTPLRYALTEGTTLRSEMTLDTAVEQSVDGQDLPSVDIPPFVLGMGVTVGEVSGGRATLDIEMESAGVGAGASPELVAQLRPSLDRVVGYHVSVVVDERGRVVASETGESAAIPTELQQFVEEFNQQLGSIVTPVPDEAVGVGARWRVVTPFELGGAELTRTTTFELTGFDGDRPQLRFDQEQVAEPGPGSFPGLPEDAAQEVVSSVVKGTGTVTADLARGLPHALTSEAEGDQVLKVESGGRSQEIRQHIGLDTTLRALP